MQARDILIKGNDTYLTILDQGLLNNYFLLDSKIGRSKDVLEFSRSEMQCYMCVKKMLLVCMHVCISGINEHPLIDIEKFKPAIINELLTGIDDSQLAKRDLSNLTLEYAR